MRLWAASKRAETVTRYRTSASGQDGRFACHGEGGLGLGSDRQERLQDFLRRGGLAGRLVEVDLEGETRAALVRFEREGTQGRDGIAPAVGDCLAGAGDLLGGVETNGIARGLDRLGKYGL